MNLPCIVLSGISPQVDGQKWQSETQLQIGRVSDLEICVGDTTVSRRHAEIVLIDTSWVVRDLGSSNGTAVNGARVGRNGHKLRRGDLVRCGQLVVRVDELQGATDEQVQAAAGNDESIQAMTERSWDKALDELVPSDAQWQQNGKEFVKLLRTGYRICQGNSLEQSLETVLNQTIKFFGAQRGAILLIDPTTKDLNIRSLVAAENCRGRKTKLSDRLAKNALSQGRSLLCHLSDTNVENQTAQSMARGTMSSIICALLRSPDRPLGILHLDRGHFQENFTEEDFFLADSLAAALSLSIERLQMIAGQQDLFIQTITALAQAIEMRDRYTGHHTHRVTTYSIMLAEEMQLSTEDRRLLQLATPLHDVGKISIDDQILRKPGHLSKAEYTQMKSHVLSGVEIAEMVPGLASAIPIIRHHHERWDGEGYPDKLAGEQIPLLARVVAVADAFDAMTSDRPYRTGMSLDKAFAEVAKHSGTHFDPNCSQAFLRLRPRIEALFSKEASFQKMSQSTEKTWSREAMEKEMREIRAGKPGETVHDETLIVA